MNKYWMDKYNKIKIIYRTNDIRSNGCYSRYSVSNCLLW